MFWYDGALRETSLQPVDLTDRGLTLGDGLFDTSLARAGKIFLRDAHLKRFAEGAAALGIPLDLGEADRALDALAESVRDGALRLTLTRGGGARGLRIPETPKPLLFGAATPGGDLAFKSLALATTAIRRNETSPASRIKALPYLDAILANKVAQDAGADEALFLNGIGHVACASTGNLFAVFGKRLVTPRLEDGVLAGTIRALVLREAEACGLEAIEQSLPLEDWIKADALFLTNSLRLIAPCSALDGKSFDSADHLSVGKLQERLRDALIAACGTF